MVQALANRAACWLLGFGALACTSSGGRGDGAATELAAALEDITRWCYWLSAPDLEALASSDCDLVVMDYSRDGSQEQAFTSAEIEALRAARPGRIVVAYLSIGEAEDYRFYWQSEWLDAPPSWLGPSNPDWGGNFKVRYWEDDWQALVVHNPGAHPVLGDGPAYLERIAATGYDGVFLDIVDAWEFWGPPGDGGNGERPTAAADMVALLDRIATVSRTIKPGFLVCQQNGEGLLGEDLEHPLTPGQRARLLDAVSWLSVEDIFYRGEAAANNPLDPDEYRIDLTDLYRAAGKTVTSIDYFDPAAPGFDAAALADYWSRALARGWHPTTGPRLLDGLGVVPAEE